MLVDGTDINQTDGAGVGFDFLEQIVVSANDVNRVLMRSDVGLQFCRGHLVQMLQSLVFRG